MGFLTSTLTTVGLSILAVIFTALAIYLSFKSIVLGGAINRFVIGVWIIAGILWSVIGFRALVNYILNDRMAQFVILIVIIMAILFVPSKKQSNNNQRGKRK